MIQKSVLILDEFSKHFNARFNSLDFVNHANDLIDILNGKIVETELHFLKLPCDDTQFDQLIKFEYVDLLIEIIKRIKIEKESYDVYRSEMSDELVAIYIVCIEALIKKTEITLDVTEKMFVINCPKLLMELLWAPISQFHIEVTFQLDYFNNLLQTASQYSDKEDIWNNFYLDSKVATPYSYFVLAFVAENLKIPLLL